MEEAAEAIRGGSESINELRERLRDRKLEEMAEASCRSTRARAPMINLVLGLLVHAADHLADL